MNRWLKIKLLIVIILWGGIITYNWTDLATYWQASQAPYVTRLVNSWKLIFDFPIEEQVQVKTQGNSRTGQTPDTPYDLSQTILNLPNYIKADGVAQAFNQAIDIDAINQSLVVATNELRREQGLTTIYLGDYLNQGSQFLLDDLIAFNYFSNTSAQGLHFYDLHSIESAPYRLSQYLYEMNISADDIRIKTWENPKILAEYILSLFPDALSGDYSNQWINLRTSATDYLVDEAAYVRFVFILVTDTPNN